MAPSVNTLPYQGGSQKKRKNLNIQRKRASMLLRKNTNLNSSGENQHTLPKSQLTDAAFIRRLRGELTLSGSYSYTACCRVKTVLSKELNNCITHSVAPPAGAQCLRGTQEKSAHIAAGYFATRQPLCIRQGWRSSRFTRETY